MPSASNTASVPCSTRGATEQTKKCITEMDETFKATSEQAKVVILVGKTGQGKSSFSEDVCESSGHAVHSIDAGTLVFQISKAIIKNKQYFIMDTPGLDPENEKEAFLQIIQGLQTVRPYAQIIGLLFFTTITVPRFDLFDRKLVSFIRKLCGDEYIPNITFITTFWTANNPSQQTVFNKQLEDLHRHWNDIFNGHAPRSYQHGRGYKANGEDNGRFLDWYTDRRQIAQHGKDLIARLYGGGAQNNTAPKIVRELAAGTPIHETDAGKFLQIKLSADASASPNKSTQDPGNKSGSDDRPAGNSSEHRPPESASSTQDNALPTPQSGAGLLQSVASIARSVVDILAFFQPNTSTGSLTNGRQRFQPANASFTNNAGFSGDRNSAVDWMKFRGLDSSCDGRVDFAKRHEIGGNPFSAGWNDSIRRAVQRGSR